VADEGKAKTLLNLMEALDDLDDVVEVTSNFDIPEDILNKLQ
jgi:transcriptional/translational regulatory protein YebC/TACO1